MMNPAWLPVKETASIPRSWSAMQSRAVALRSPAVISMSSSRPGRVSDTSAASLRRSSVSLPMALITTTTSSPRLRVRVTWSATARIRSASATEVPPNFWTISATAAVKRGPGNPSNPNGPCRVAVASGPPGVSGAVGGARGSRTGRRRYRDPPWERPRRNDRRSNVEPPGSRRPGRPSGADRAGGRSWGWCSSSAWWPWRWPP